MQLSGELSKVSFVNLLQLVRSGGLAGKHHRKGLASASQLMMVCLLMPKWKG
jgi:hypothetical protein